MKDTIKHVDYHRMDIYNPEADDIESYYVKLDDQRLFRDIVQVSDGWMNHKIENEIVMMNIKIQALSKKVANMRTAPLCRRVFKLWKE